MSFIVYLVYFFVADLISGFKIYKTAKSLLSSPPFYFMLLLILGCTVLVDITIITLEREIKTPIYHLFRSIEEKASNPHEKHRFYAKIAVGAKRMIFGP